MHTALTSFIVNLLIASTLLFKGDVLASNLTQEHADPLLNIPFSFDRHMKEVTQEEIQDALIALPYLYDRARNCYGVVRPSYTHQSSLTTFMPLFPNNLYTECFLLNEERYLRNRKYDKALVFYVREFLDPASLPEFKALGLLKISPVFPTMEILQETHDTPKDIISQSSIFHYIYKNTEFPDHIRWTALMKLIKDQGVYATEKNLKYIIRSEKLPEELKALAIIQWGMTLNNIDGDGSAPEVCKIFMNSKDEIIKKVAKEQKYQLELPQIPPEEFEKFYKTVKKN